MIRLNVINTDYTVYFTICHFMCEINPGTHKGKHLVLSLKLGMIKLVIRAVLTVGHKPRLDWMFLRT
jgi:hypothetical protein